MQEIYKANPNKKKLVKATTISVALFVAAIMIVSSIPTMATPINTTKKNIDVDIKVDPAGLDPNRVTSTSIAEEASLNLPSGPITQPLPFAEEMYGYVAYAGSSGHPEGPCKWQLSDPGTIVSLGNTQSGNFIAGGTWTCDERWLGCEYNTGVLWEFDPESGDMWSIGGGGTGCHGLAWDPVYNRLYGTSGTSLIEYDPDTGEQETIGSHNQGGKTMIALAINLEGICYGWDVLFSGSSTLFTIDLETGEATEYASFGEPLVYAQDGAFDWDTDILWFTAYYSYGFLAYWDFDTDEMVVIDNFEGNAEITASMLRAPCIPPEHDVGVKTILKPVASGHAIPEMEMELLCKNYGNNTETFDAQMEIIKCEESGEALLDEDFSGSTFPPENWSTDFWKKQYTNVASGESPEARVYKYDQYYGGQYYDNYIQTEEIDCTGWEKIVLTFRWASDLSYPQYTAFYVKYRKNDTSPWKDVSPWDNPLGEESEGDLYQIDCYGFGDDLGANFSILFQYIGYYYYFNYFWLDDIHVEGCGGCAEYAELVEDITLDPGEETTVVLPGWPPSEWHNESFQDTWEAYPVHGFVIMEGDQNPRNDDKWKLLELYYPWFYDIEITEIGSPQEERSMPAQTFAVEATITNVGQFEMCCIPIDIMIGEPVVLDTLLTQYDWPGSYYYPGGYDGWTDEHKNLVYYYGWRRSYSSNSGGDPYEAYIPYYYARADYVFYSAAFDTSSVSSLNLNFLSYINHWAGQGLYALEAGYSHDGENWFAAWHEEPGGSGRYEVSVPIEGGSATTYIGFWCKGNPYYFNYWYLDNVEVVAMGLIEEYSDTMCQGDDLVPGTSRVFEFDDWTPEFLAEETTGQVEYRCDAAIEAEGDVDPGNDIMVNTFALDYWHDPALKEVTSPSNAGRGDLLWDNGLPDGRNGLAGSMYYGYENILVDDFENENTWFVTDGHFRFVWNSGYGPGNMETVRMYFFEEVDDCEPSQDEYFEIFEVDSFVEYATGDYYFGRPEIACDVEFSAKELPPGRWWVGFQADGISENIAYMLTAEGFGCEIMADLPYWGYPRWSSSSYLWGQEYDLAWMLTGYSTGPPGINAYIQPGTESIDAVAINLGTFQSLDLTCYAEIWEYISDPDNGSMQYQDNITNIDLTVPLGGEVALPFDDFTFAYEGRYGLYLEMPASPDDDEDNNAIRFGVGVDDTEPESMHTLTPPEPDGENGWYVSDVEVGLSASDPLVMDVSSGVDKIQYKVNDGPTQTMECPPNEGTFLLTVEDDLENCEVEYWAVDNVGNEETPHHIFNIDMDQTPCDIDLVYEVAGGSPDEGWLMVFTATASDDTSGMDRVEFFLNEALQETVTGPGPTYEWSFVYHGGLNLAVRVDGYDIAGNINSDIIDPVEATNYQNIHQQTKTVDLRIV